MTCPEINFHCCQSPVRPLVQVSVKTESNEKGTYIPKSSSLVRIPVREAGFKVVPSTLHKFRMASFLKDSRWTLNTWGISLKVSANTFNRDYMAWLCRQSHVANLLIIYVKYMVSVPPGIYSLSNTHV